MNVSRPIHTPTDHQVDLSIQCIKGGGLGELDACFTQYPPHRASSLINGSCGDSLLSQREYDNISICNSRETGC